MVQRPSPGHSSVPPGPAPPCECVLRKCHSRFVAPAEPSRGACLSPPWGQRFPPASHLGWRLGTCRFQDLKEMRGVTTLVPDSPALQSSYGRDIPAPGLSTTLRFRRPWAGRPLGRGPRPRCSAEARSTGTTSQGMMTRCPLAHRQERSRASASRAAFRCLASWSLVKAKAHPHCPRNQPALL